MAFVCLIFTGFTPIPFEPFRFAAILAALQFDLVFAGSSNRTFPTLLSDGTHRRPIPDSNALSDHSSHLSA